jgi:hypothetical protein
LQIEQIDSPETKKAAPSLVAVNRCYGRRTDRVGYSLPVSSGVAVTRITRGPFVGFDYCPVIAPLQLGG